LRNLSELIIHLKIRNAKPKAFSALGSFNSEIFFFYFPKILNNFVPHFGQEPVKALLFVFPFPFIVTSFSPDISLFALHFTQYA